MKGGESSRRDAAPDGGAEVIELAFLPRRARPIPFAELEYDEVQQRRALDCGYYGACLEFAARVRWRGFSCRRCPFKDSHAECAEDFDEPMPATAASVIQLR